MLIISTSIMSCQSYRSINIEGIWRELGTDSSYVNITHDRIIYGYGNTRFVHKYSIISHDLMYIERLWVAKSKTNYSSTCNFYTNNDTLIIHNILPSPAEVYPPIYSNDLTLIRTRQ